MKWRHAFVAEAANVTSGGSLNLLGIFGKLNVPATPGLAPSIHWIGFLELDGKSLGKRCKFVVSVSGPSGEVLRGEGELLVPDDPNQRIMNVHLPIHNVALPEIGAYVASVDIEGVKSGRAEFEVVLIEENSNSGGQ